MKNTFFTTILLLSLVPFSGHAQAQDIDSLTFSKGRILTSLYGTLSNQKVNITSGEEIRTTGYTLGTKSGQFIKNNWVLGLNFALSKSDIANAGAAIESEDLLLGLWSRLYFAQKGSAALYAELTPYYTGIHRQTIIRDNDNAIITDEDITGSGFGVIPGFGFTYIISRNVGFGMTVSYPLAKIYTNTEDLILATTTSDTYKVTQLQFSFNFQIYLDQFFF